MLQPKKIRWRKHHKELSRIRGKSPRGASLNFGQFGLKAIELLLIDLPRQPLCMLGPARWLAIFGCHGRTSPHR